MPYFSLSRNLELSTIYHLETNINSDWTGIKTVKSFNSAYKEPLPVVAVYLSSINNDRKEIGSTELVKEAIINIDIFAKSDGQRIDLADYIVDKLKDQFTYYIHSQASGNPETLSRVAEGSIMVRDFITDTKLNLGENVDQYDKYRHFLQFSIRKSD